MTNEEKEPQQDEEKSDVEEQVPLTCEEELLACQMELAESKNETLRVHAEFSNFQKRVLKEKDAALAYAHEAIAKDLLAVLDTFEQALASMTKSDEAVNEISAIKEGVELTYEQLKKTLAKHGVSEIVMNGDFDANFHQAIMQVDSDAHESGQVVQVFQKGYLLKERLLRPAMVSTAK